MSGSGRNRGDDPSVERADRSAPRAAPIARLTPAVASQLAAGEVVERPASVIKELVENSLDAGARNVSIDLEEGGVRAMRIADDGGGIRRDDLALALERHATSKIASVDDLFRVASLGFRGEALASIAAVSRLTLTSRAGGEDSGWRIRGGGGEPEPARHPTGTTVEVRDLFYNVPARRRFLRAERTELQHAIDAVRRLALARPDVALRVRHADRTAFQARHAATRVDEVVGRGFAASAAPVEAAAEGMNLRGWIGTGSAPRQFFFLNGRWVRDRALGHAVRVALEGRLPSGSDAVTVLFLALDPTRVDVNVHPGKHEVRFRQPREVHDFLVAAIRRAAGGGFGALAVREPGGPPYHGPTGREVAEGGSGAPPDHHDRPPRARSAPLRAEARDAPPGASDGAPEGTAREERLPAAVAPRAPRPAQRPPAPGRAGGPMPSPARTAFGWVAGRYAVVELDARVFVVDLARALELAVRAACAGASDARPVPSLPLLVPARVKVGEAVLDRFEPEAVVRFGLVLRRLGPDLASLLEVPRLLRHCEPTAVARAVIEAGGHDGTDDLAAALGRAAGSAVPAARAERDALLGELLRRPEAVLGPAGARELGEREIERLFGR